MQNIDEKMVDTLPTAAATGGSSLGMNLSSGMEAAVTAALSFLEQVLCDINNKELQESRGLATAIQESSEYSAINIINAGYQQFVDGLAQGFGTIGSSILTLGTMACANYTDPTKTEFAKLNQEQTGIENVHKEIPQAANPIVNEQEAPVYGPDTQEEAQAQADRAQAVDDKIEEIKEQKIFIDREGIVFKLSDEDAELLKTMDQKQAKTLNDHLEQRLGKIAEQRTVFSKMQSEHYSKYAAIGQALGQMGQGIGKSIGAFMEEAQTEAQANAQLSNSAVQGIQAILSQLVKTADDALSQAQQTIQTFASISNGNKFQG